VLLGTLGSLAIQVPYTGSGLAQVLSSRAGVAYEVRLAVLLLAVPVLRGLPGWRWPTWAARAVGLIAVSGVVQGILPLGPPMALVTTSYGRLLLVKVGLFAAVLGLGALANQPYAAELASPLYRLRVEIYPARVGRNSVHLFAVDQSGVPPCVRPTSTRRP
jgi:hypothetical protein